jgi:AraC-like DNA-binding protein
MECDMGILLQAKVDLSDRRPMPSLVPRLAPDETDDGRAPVPVKSAVRLLSEASRALWSDQEEAQRYIAQAAALLESESGLRETGIEASRGANRSRLAPWQVKRVLRFIDEKLDKKIGVRDFALITRLSCSHFARAFRATIGESPHAYVIRRRIERAQEMILLTEKPLARIALDCGLADQAHMTRLFRRAVGVPPGAWRRQHGAGAGDLGKSLPSNARLCERGSATERPGTPPRGGKPERLGLEHPFIRTAA